MEKDWVELGPEERLVRRTAFRAILAGSPGGPQEIAFVAGLDSLINFFCSVEHLDWWRSRNLTRGGRRITLQEAAEIGKVWWAEVGRWDPSLLGLLRGTAGARPAYLAVALALSGVVLIWADRRANLWALLHFGGEPGITMVTLVAIAGSWLLLASTWLLSRYGCRHGRR